MCWQGTFYFKAYELLLAETGPKILHEPHHDLESAYWVLLSVVLQHTAHNLAPDIANDIFPYNTRNGHEAAKRKLAWLFGRTGAGAGCASGSTVTKNRTAKLRIKDNAPLTEMMGELRTLVLRNVYRDAGESPVLTYDAVLDVFDRALAKSGWPFDDWVPERGGQRKMLRGGSERTNIRDLQAHSEGQNDVGSAVREAGAMQGKKRKLNSSSPGPDADRAQRKSEGKVKVLRF